MSISKTFAGVSYALPLNREAKGWGTAVSSFLIAVADNAIPKSGGSYTLTAELNLGATYGVLAAYLKSAGANIAATGVIRLANLEAVTWRNQANGADLALSVNSSNALQFNGANVLSAGAASIVNADVSASAAIAYSKLNLSNSVATGDLAAALLVPITKGGTGQITAALAYPALSPLTTKGDLQAYSTTTARLAVGTNNQVLTADSTVTNGLKWADAGGGGSGEVNAVTNPSAASVTTGYSNGTSHTISRITSGSPLDPVTSTALRSTATANAVESSTSGNYFSITTMPTGLRNKKLKVEFYFTSPASDTWAVSVYGGARMSLSTDASGASVIPAGTTGKYTTTFDADASTAYTVNFTRTAGSGSTTFDFTNLIVGPGIQPQGAVVGEWLSYTPTFGTGYGTAAAVSFKYRRDGSSVEILGSFTVGTAAASAATISLPTGLTVDTALVTAGKTKLGEHHRMTAGSFVTSTAASTLGQKTSVLFYSTTSGSSLLRAASQINGLTPPTFRDDDGTDVTATGETVSIRASIPIAEWAGSGTVNLAANDVEYISHDGTSLVYGPGGSLVPNQAVGTAVTRTMSGINNLVTDAWILEYNNAGLGWAPATTIYPWASQGAKQYGIQHLWSTATAVRVLFAIGGALGDNATYAGNSATAWAAEFSAGSRWRLRRFSGGQAVGFGLATSTSAGLVNPYSTNGVVYSGTYTPTASNLSGCSASSAQISNYTRVGNMVTVMGRVDITVTTTNTDVSYEITLPVATANFSTGLQALGTAFMTRVAANTRDPGYVTAVSGAQRAIIAWDGVAAGTGTAQATYFTFMYQIQ